MSNARQQGAKCMSKHTIELFSLPDSRTVLVFIIIPSPRAVTYSNGIPQRGLKIHKNTWAQKNSQFSANMSLYVGNCTR